MTVLHEIAPRLRHNSPIASVLHTAHQGWLEETSEYLTPLLGGYAPFWDRWTAVRYLADQFLPRLRRERALVDTFSESLPPEIWKSLTQEGERIGQLQRKLDNLGRRRGTAWVISPVAGELLHALQAWCADIELVVRQISRDALPEKGRKLLARLEPSSTVAT